MTDALFHPSRRAYRLSLLLIVSFVVFGAYFAYDSVSAIADLIKKEYGTDEGGIGAMYTAYHLGAILTLLVSGLLLDRIGIRRASLLFSGLLTLGAVIVSWAPTILMMGVGRFIFGIGAEALVVAQSAMLARWFRGKELALSFGVTLTISRLATLFTWNIEPLIGKRDGPGAALSAAAGVCALSFIFNLFYVAMDKRADSVLRLEKEEARIPWKEVWRFPVSFWYLTSLCLAFYSALYAFTSLSKLFFMEKWNLPDTVPITGHFFTDLARNFTHLWSTAPGTASILSLASMCTAPFVGQIVDKIGKRASLMVLGAFLMIPAYLVLGFSTSPPGYPMIVLAGAFVLVPAAMWPAVPLIVDTRRVGSAYAIMTLVQNVGLMAFPWFNGKLRVATAGYTTSMLMFASLGVVGLIFAVRLKRSDTKMGNILERPEGSAAA